MAEVPFGGQLVWGPGCRVLAVGLGSGSVTHQISKFTASSILRKLRVHGEFESAISLLVKQALCRACPMVGPM